MKAKIPKLHLACSNDDLRPAMQYVKINGNVGTATNGHVLIRSLINDGMYGILDLENIDGKMIHKDIWEEMTKCNRLVAKEDHIIGRMDNYDVHFIIDQPDEEYPNFIPITEKLNNEPKEIDFIHFSPSVIDMVKRATPVEYHSSLKFTFYGKEKPCLVTCHELEGFILIMPMMWSGNDNESEYLKPFLTMENPTDHLIEREYYG